TRSSLGGRLPGDLQAMSRNFTKHSLVVSDSPSAASTVERRYFDGRSEILALGENWTAAYYDRGGQAVLMSDFMDFATDHADGRISLERTTNVLRGDWHVASNASGRLV